MSEHEPEVREAVEAWMAGAGADPGEHPEPETLAAYHARELPEEDEQRVQDHLLVCRECAALLLDLEELGDPGFGHEIEIPPDTGAEIWERLRQEIRAEQPAPPIPFPSPRRSAPSRWLSALAAALLVAVIGLSAWVASLRQTVADLSRPEVNAPVLDLVPAGSGPRAGSAAPVAEVPSGARKFTLILSPARRGDFPSYEMEIARADGAVLRRTGLQPNVYGSFSLIETRRALGAGEHGVRLFGVRNGRRELLGSYVVRIAPPSPATEEGGPGD